jgi:hypothetical protein
MLRCHAPHVAKRRLRIDGAQTRDHVQPSTKARVRGSRKPGIYGGSAPAIRRLLPPKTVERAAGPKPMLPSL